MYAGWLAQSSMNCTHLDDVAQPVKEIGWDTIGVEPEELAVWGGARKFCYVDSCDIRWTVTRNFAENANARSPA